jgi:acetylornithine deacetylase
VKAVAELLAGLIRIDSSNPGLAADGAGESTIAAFVAGWLRNAGAEITTFEGTEGRPSIVARWSGTGGGRSLILNGHLDTVSLESYGGGPLEPVVEAGRMYGRGAYDMKSGLAAMMIAGRRAASVPHRGDILLALVADEEFASAGTEEVLRHVTADGAIVVEPSELELTVAHRGFVWARVTVRGVAAHGSRPDLGVDAIVSAGRFLAALGDLGDELSNRPPHPLLGTASVHASIISGGVELSSYPAECIIDVEWRTLPDEDPVTVRAELDTLAATVTARDDRVAIEVETGISRQPFEAIRGSEIVTILSGQIAAHTGRPAIERGEPFWTDCALIADAGIPVVLFGVTGGGAHAASEWVDLRSLGTVADVLEATISEFCS